MQNEEKHRERKEHSLILSPPLINCLGGLAVMQRNHPRVLALILLVNLCSMSPLCLSVTVKAGEKRGDHGSDELMTSAGWQMACVKVLVRGPNVAVTAFKEDPKVLTGTCVRKRLIQLL